MASRWHRCIKCDHEIYNNEMFEPAECNCGSRDFLRGYDESSHTQAADLERESRAEQRAYETDGSC